MNKKRKVEKFNWMSSLWEECNPIDVKELDMFRLFEPDGEPVKTKRLGIIMFVAISDIIINEDGIEEIEIYLY